MLLLDRSVKKEDTASVNPDLSVPGALPTLPTSCQREGDSLAVKIPHPPPAQAPNKS